MAAWPEEAEGGINTDLVYYNGEHSAIIGNKHTWNDWHLIPTSKIVIPPPNVKTKMVDIPGANGSIDLTSILTGYPTYENRTGSIEFILAPGFDGWESTYSDMLGYLHGRTYVMYLDDDPGFYYSGRFSVDAFNSDKSLNKISIGYNLYPFKKEIKRSDEDYLWDPFNFERDKAISYNEMTVAGTLELTISDCYEPVTPSVTVSSSMTITHTYILDGYEESDEYNVDAGTSTPGFVLQPGDNVLTIVGDGTITISYRGGRL